MDKRSGRTIYLRQNGLGLIWRNLSKTKPLQRWYIIWLYHMDVKLSWNAILKKKTLTNVLGIMISAHCILPFPIKLFTIHFVVSFQIISYKVKKLVCPPPPRNLINQLNKQFSTLPFLDYWSLDINLHFSDCQNINLLSVYPDVLLSWLIQCDRSQICIVLGRHAQIARSRWSTVYYHPPFYYECRHNWMAGNSTLMGGPNEYRRRAAGTASQIFSVDTE